MPAGPRVPTQNMIEALPPSEGAGAVNRMERRLLTVDEVAAWLRVSRAWVLDHALGRRRPYLPSVKLGRAVRFEPEEVDAFIAECRRLNELLKRRGRVA